MGPTHLTATMLCVDITWHWEASLQNFLRIIQRSLQKVLEVFILRHVLVSSFPPLGYGLYQNKATKTAVEALTAAFTNTCDILPLAPSETGCQ